MSPKPETPEVKRLLDWLSGTAEMSRLEAIAIVQKLSRGAEVRAAQAGGRHDREGGGMSDNLLRRLRQHALPDPYDEREVLHAPLLRQAANALDTLTRERDALRAEAERLREALRAYCIRGYEARDVDGRYEHAGGLCGLCGTEWGPGQPERHATGCLAAKVETP